jgi:tRNA(fMet)-specific endonuclease VapC
MRYLLDSDACIALMRGHGKIVEKVASVAPDDLGVSTVTWFELFTGVAKCDRPDRERAKLELLRAMVHDVVFNLPSAVEAANIRAELESRGESIGPYDTLLAGQARSLQLVLVTGNTNEFARVPGLLIENWNVTA